MTQQPNTAQAASDTKPASVADDQDFDKLLGLYVDGVAQKFELWNLIDGLIAQAAAKAHDDGFFEGREFEHANHEANKAAPQAVSEQPVEWPDLPTNGYGTMSSDEIFLAGARAAVELNKKGGMK